MEAFFSSQENLDFAMYCLRLSDIQESLIKQWRGIFRRSKIDCNTRRLPYRWNIDPHHTVYNCLLEIIREEISAHHLNTSSSHVFIVTDENGVVLETFGKESLLQRMEEMNLGKGTSLDLKYSGINGVSLAKELKRPVIVRGDEHDLALFSGWTCICTPIVDNDGNVAYLDLSFHYNADITFAIPFLKLLSNKIQEKLCSTKKYFSFNSNSKISNLFDAFRLTPREKEIATLWLHNKTYTEIASELFLSSETVRCYIKKIHQKTGAKNKADFIKKITILSS